MALAANANSPLQKLRAALKSCLFGQGGLVYLTGPERDWSWSVGPQWEPLPFPLTSALVLVLGGRRAPHTAAAATLSLSIFISAHKFTHLCSLWGQSRWGQSRWCSCSPWPAASHLPQKKRRKMSRLPHGSCWGVERQSGINPEQVLTHPLQLSFNLGLF